MALEKRNPLPIGWYWVDIPAGPRNDAFGLWVQRNAITVKEAKEHREENVILPDGDVEVITYLFYVPEPTQWEDSTFPTIASQETTIDDTVQRPEPMPDIADQVLDALPTPHGLMWMGAAVVAIGLGVLLSRRR